MKFSKSQQHSVYHRTYFSHRPYLIQTLNRLVKYERPLSILELGAGDGSSAIFNQYASKYPITITGLESNPEWLNKMQKYAGPTYKFYLTDWHDLPRYHQKYDLIFIDQAPWRARIDSFVYFKDCFKYCIIHDFSVVRRFAEFQRNIGNFEVRHYTKDYPTTAVIVPPIKYFY